jgi:membrane fusion protein, adhesin transport system
MSPEGFPFYRVRIEIEKSYFENGELRYELFPGMQVIASIHTGERTVLEYILDPLRHRMSNAFQER